MRQDPPNLHCREREKGMTRLFIDAESMKSGMRIYHALRRLKSTESIDKPVNYWFGGVQPEVKLELDTTMSEDELDAWCYKVKAASGYIGVGSIQADFKH